MRKTIAAINMTVDGFCDHTSLMADDEIHQHYTALLNSADALLYGRITYQLMKDYWPALVKNPSGNKQTDAFAMAIDKIQKIVFSRTMENAGWNNATLATGSIKEEMLALRRQPGREILVGSPGLIVAALNLNLIDEFQLCVQPIIAGKGLPLFKDINDRINLTLLKTKTFTSGSVLYYYKPSQ
jgi:dihydrofolate reductase